jgi:hypothetical protein
VTEHMTQAQARALTSGLILKHGLVGWTVRFNNAKKTAGTADSRTKVITLSKILLAHRSYEDSWQTVTHEIAHAIVGTRHGHDPVWVRKHKELGGNGRVCFVDDGGYAKNHAPWVGRCAHGQEFPRFKRPKVMTGYLCPCPAGRTPVEWEKR